jgi:DnaK suppressor protein
LLVQTEADVFDEIQHALDRALVVRNLNHGSSLLRQVRDAVQRIGSGKYGVCEECGEEINSRRLAAVPWASLCLRCQEQSDSRQTESDEWPGLCDSGIGSGAQSGGRLRRILQA